MFRMIQPVNSTRLLTKPMARIGSKKQAKPLHLSNHMVARANKHVL